MPYNGPRRQRGGNVCPIMAQGGKEVGMFALYWPKKAKRWECSPCNGPRRQRGGNVCPILTQGGKEVGMFALY